MTGPVRERPAWVKQGLVTVGNWEPLTFIRRRGGHPIEDVENWNAERTEAAARKLKEAGVTLAITNLHKGFGLKTESADIEATRRFTGFAHKYGLRVGGYVGATMAHETFFLEEPDARNWAQVDEFGRPVYYNNAQTFRYAACRNNPGYDAFVKKVLRLGVQDLGLDMIHFDQMQGWAEPRSCRCRYCTEAFRAFLKQSYAPEKLIERFGFTRLEGVVPPPFNTSGAIALDTVANPLVQDWGRFRAANFANHYGDYDRYIHQLNSLTALEGNPNLDLAANRGFSQGVDIQQMLEHGDVVWSESPDYALWTADGRLVSKIRAFKAVRKMGKSLFMYTGGRYGTQNPDSPPQLRLAEAMAYNDNNLGMVGDVSPDGVNLTPEARRYIDFFHAHSKEFTGTVPVADAAVLRAFASVEFNPAYSLAGAVLFEQALIQNRVPFDIVFDRQLGGLSKYKVLVLANQDALSDTQVETIRKYVEGGGGLVATGQSSLLTDWRLRRRKLALGDLLGTDLPPASDAPNTPVRRTFGKGRVVYIPRIEAVTEGPPAQVVYRLGNEFWKLPANHRAMVDAVVWAAGGALSARVSGPPSMTAEVARRENGDTLLHLVNFNWRKPVENVEAAVRIPAGFQLREAVLETPEGGAPQTLATVVRGDELVVRVPRVSVYSLLWLRGAPQR